MAEQKLKKLVLSPEERAAEIDYLKNLFRLTFRTTDNYDEMLQETDNSDDGNDYFYDDRVDVACEAAAGFSHIVGADDDEMAEYAADFAALGATDVFNELCRDYYQDQLTELRRRAKVLDWRADVLRARQEVDQVTKPKYFKNRLREVAAAQELNQAFQAELTAVLAKLPAAPEQGC